MLSINHTLNGKKGEEKAWGNTLEIIIVLILLGVILLTIFGKPLIKKFITSINPSCPVACKAVSDCALASDFKEYEDGSASCEIQNTRCCIPYDSAGSPSGTGAPGQTNGINSDNEGKTCTLRGNTGSVFVYDYKGDCTTNCADSANKKYRTDYCGGTTGITTNFECTCNAAEKTALEAYRSGKVFEKLCPGTGTDARYCCDKKFDKSAPQLTIDASPIPTANSYSASYTIEVSCKDESLNGPGIGCDKNMKYFLLRSNTPITSLKKDCNGINFQNATNNTFQDDRILLNITNESLSLINDGQYAVGEGFKGNLYLVLCAKDLLGNTIIQKSSALPFIAAGSLTNCLKSSQTTVEKRCITLPVPCFKDNGEKATDPKAAGLLCSGVEFYYDSLTACTDNQKTMPLCQP